ncbi:CDP-diacylglycerol--glycerol-3-phosphate 3-phosphatidyltransferase [Candidatus Rhabdochlamydia oedothoracis]|uniref:CDP-diacylglycerol--glycerol-3-phosphate 3-phosphatidyltransferase n=1 Tax=Candidatus Rhabdochlamydia oedothoracis TaxID=2720720 RepID=A0ABX8V4R4_9BACT|nr:MULTISPECIES: CDP-alcohol phosphatidyltransferase family protein [Rhabdochlamydia]KAG6559528.1 CDP-diacylglycerol--glycerol-3-phosphate 3-phosphatidyltransferase [Candidatus Rhabdochlamydia sp. W815]MCL6756758.1 CDP-alcohol phosphatidyltransferase family protein [Candidatus Rhabdochlamydia oedothoracis]QYF48455.1 CDP-diacylglycerol--glycerol-3-phosphate 3-phosphatidyltransferase [Candidatus Rhabdochlamydia oedothoracis]
MSIALILTLLRILLGPIFVVLYLYYDQLGFTLLALPYVLLCLTVLSEVSDVFDGLLARRYNKVTDLGKLLDPMADSIFRLSVFLAFTQGVIQLPLLLVCIFFYRDIVISTLRALCGLRGFALAARLSGKIKAVVQAVIIFFILVMLIPYSLGYLELSLLRKLSVYSVSIGVIYTLYSGCEYILANRAYIQKALGLKR